MQEMEKERQVEAERQNVEYIPLLQRWRMNINHEGDDVKEALRGCL